MSKTYGSFTISDISDGVGIAKSIPYYLASNKSTGVTVNDPGWSRTVPELTPENKYLWIYYANVKGVGDSEPVLIEESGETVTFDNNGGEAPLDDIKVNIEPVQDLNGYNNPWPAGCGKNLLPYATNDTETVRGVTWVKNNNGSISFSGTCSEAVSSNFVSFKLSAGSYLFSNVGSTTAFSGGNATIIYIRDLDNSVTLASIGFGQISDGKQFSLSNETNVRFYVVFQKDNVVSGTLYPMIRLASETDATYEPYSNVCPMTGFTGVSVTRTGKNLWDEVYTGISTYSTVKYRAVFIGDNTVTLSTTTPLNSRGNANLFLLSGNVNTGASTGENGVYSGVVRTASSIDGYVTIGYRNYQDADPQDNETQLEFGTIATEYEPYHGKVYGITFPSEAGIVYGGTLDVTTGELIVDMEKVTITNITRYASNNAHYRLGDINYVVPGEAVSNMLKYTQVAASAIPVNAFSVVNSTAYNGAYVYFKIDGLTSAEDYRNYITELNNAGTPLEVCYHIAEPTTYHLTPQQVIALFGENHIWSDSNSVDVSRYANVSMGDPYVIGVYGDSSTAYRLIISDSVVTKDTVGNYSPSTITVSAKAQTGVDAVGDYAGRFKIQTTTDNSTWTDRYTSSSAETSKTYTVPANIAAIRCILYDSSGANLLDQQTVPIIADAKGVSSIQEQYYLSTSDSEQTGGSWQDTPQTYISGRYYWTRSEITWDDNTVTHTTPVLANDINSVMDANADANNKIAQMSEIIYGTQTEKTRFWTGTSSTLTELTDGTQISYWLPYNYLEETATSKGITASELTPAETITSKYSNDWLKLTLADGTTTAWVPCYYGGTSRLTSHYGANNLIKLTYRTNVGSIAYGWWADANYNANTNYFDRRQHSGAVKAATAITAKTLIGGTIAGYKTLGANVEFDLGYPILYASAAIAANATRTDTYEALNGVDFSITGAIQSDGTANAAKMLYLKGSVTDNVFKCATTNWLTTVVPASADDMYYIPLGVMTSEIAGYFATSNRLYGYYNGAFQALDTAGIGLAVTAQSTIDNLQIGGRNLLLWTGDMPLATSNSVTDKSGVCGWNAFYPTKTDDGMKVTGANISNECIGFPLANNGNVESNDDVILSFEARGNIVSTGRIYWIQSSGNNVNSNSGWADDIISELSDTEWKRFSIKLQTEDANIRTCTKLLLFYQLGSSNNGKWIELRKSSVKLEKSSKPTDWTPAPEDVSSKIETALTSIEDLTTQLDGKVETWICNVNPATNWNASEYENHDGDLWFYTGLTNSTVGSITIEPAKTYQFNGDGTWSSYNNPTESLFDRIDGKTSIYYGTKDNYIVTGKEEDRDYLVDSDSGKTYTWDANASGENKWVLVTDYMSDIADAVDDTVAVVGRRNYLRKTAMFTAADWAINNTSLVTVPEIGVLKLAPTTAAVYAKYKVDYLTYAMLKNKTVTFSFDGREVGTGTSGRIRVLYALYSPSRVSNTIASANDRYSATYLASKGTEWSRYSITIKVPESLTGGVALSTVTDDWLFSIEMYREGSLQPVEFRNFKLEIGENDTFWTAAPEDSIASLDVEYYLSDSSSALSGGSWQTVAPAWVDGKYMWSRQKLSYPNGVIEYKNETCIAGAKGSTGAAGLNQATLYLYKRSTTAPTTKPTGMTYTFASKALSGTFNDWSQSIPNTSTDPIWITMATASSNTASDDIGDGEWTAPVMIAQNGQNGDTGASGYNQATIYLYQRAASSPAKPTTEATYTFSSGALTNIPSGWSTTIPATDSNKYPCWVTSAAAISQSASIGVSGWSAVSKLVEDGTDGKDGYTVILTNEAHQFAAGTSAAIGGESVDCNIVAYKGTTQIAATIGSITGVPTGMTVTPSGSGSTNAKITVSVNNQMVTQSGTLTIPITVDSKSFSKTFSYSLSLTGSSGVSATGLMAIVNADGFNSSNNGEVYYHGYDDDNKPADVDGWVQWNGRKVTIPKGMHINPNKVLPYDNITVIYNIYRLSSATVDTGTFYDVYWNNTSKAWMASEYNSSGAPQEQQAWTWNEATDIILAMYVNPSSEGAITNFQLFSPPKKYSELTEQIGSIASQAQSDINNLEVGGRNLLRGTSTPIQNTNVKLREATISNNLIVATPTSSDSTYIKWIVDYLDYEEYGNGEYTLSCEVKGVDSESTYTSSNLFMYVGIVPPSRITAQNLNSSYDKYGSISIDNINRDSWTKYSYTLKVPDDLNKGPDSVLANGSMLTAQLAVSKEKLPVAIRNIKLEKGNRASDYTPAPEDVDANIESAVNSIEIGGKNIFQGTGSVSQYDKWVFLRGAVWSKGIVRLTPDSGGSFARHSDDYLLYGDYKDQGYVLSFDGKLVDPSSYDGVAPNLITGTTDTIVTEANLSGSEYHILTSFYYFTAEGQAALTGNTTDYVTVSFDYQTVGAESGGAEPPFIYAQINIAQGNSKRIYVKPNERGHAVCTFKLIDDQATYSARYRLRFRLRYTVEGAKMRITHPKVIIGTEDTPWVPSPGEASYDSISMPNDVAVYLGTITPERNASATNFLSASEYYARKYINLIQDYNWHRYSVNFSIPEDFNLGEISALADTNFLQCQFALSGGDSALDIRNVKLEKGNKASDWTPAPEDTESQISTLSEQTIEYIVGTQTEATGDWTGITLGGELKAGKTIAYKLPFAGLGNASLTLSYVGGGDTGAKPVFMNNTRVTTHYPQYTVIKMTYDGEAWRTDNYYSNSNTYDRRLHNDAVTATTAITKAHLIAGTASGYKNLAAGLTFDLSYPLLYASDAIAAGGTGKTTYEAMPNVKFSNNGTIQYDTAAANKMLYLKGSLTGNTFTIASSNWLTTVVPTSADNMYYIPLGLMTSNTNGYFSSSNRLYGFFDGKFQAADLAGVTIASAARAAISDLETQLDQKILTWAQSTNPATAWTTADLRSIHNGDLWYYNGSADMTIRNSDNSQSITIENNNTYKYRASDNFWTLQASADNLFDKIDGKMAIFYGTPEDTFSNVEDGDLLIDPDGTNYKWDATNQEWDIASETVDSYFLETPFEWSQDGSTATFQAIIYKGQVDVTNQYPAAWFEWYLRTEQGDTRVETGKTYTVSKSALGYGGTVSCTFTTYENNNTPLTTRSIKGLQTRSGLTLTTYSDIEGVQPITELPTKLSSAVNMNDYFMVIDAADGCQVSVSEMSKAILNRFTQSIGGTTRSIKTAIEANQTAITANQTSITANQTAITSKVSKSGDTMTGPLTLSAADTVNLNFTTTSGGSTSYIRVYKDSSESSYGNNMVIQSGGSLIIGSGESAQMIYDNNLDSSAGDVEDTIISADGAINLYANIGDYSNRQKWRLGSSGSMNAPGSINIVDPSGTVGDVPSSNISGCGYILRDSQNVTMAYFRSRYLSDGKTGFSLDAQRSVGGSSVYNGLSLLIDSSGNRSVAVTDPLIWRKALGITTGSSANPVSIPANSYTDRSYSFGTTYPSAPTVYLTLNGTGDNAYRGSVSAMVSSVSKTEVTVRFYNASSAAVSVHLHWLAIGESVS